MKNTVVFLFAGLMMSCVEDDAVSAPAYLEKALHAIPKGETRRVRAVGTLLRSNLGVMGRDLFVLAAGDHLLPIREAGILPKDIEAFQGHLVEGNFEIGHFPLKSSDAATQPQGFWITDTKNIARLEAAHFDFESRRDPLEYDIAAYRGNGVLLDSGPRWMTDRFHLELGSVDFSKKAELTYKMKGLPPVDFTIGFTMEDMPPMYGASSGKEFDYKAAASRGKEFNRAKVGMRLKSEDGSVVFTAEEDLVDWTWKGTARYKQRFVYLSEDPGQGGNAYRFVPDAGKEYELLVKISPLPGSKGVKPAKLRVTGGGWQGR